MSETYLSGGPSTSLQINDSVPGTSEYGVNMGGRVGVGVNFGAWADNYQNDIPSTLIKGGLASGLRMTSLHQYDSGQYTSVFGGRVGMFASLGFDPTLFQDSMFYVGPTLETGIEAGITDGSLPIAPHPYFKAGFSVEKLGIGNIAFGLDVSGLHLGGFFEFSFDFGAAKYFGQMNDV